MLPNTVCSCTHVLSEHYQDDDKVKCNRCDCGGFTLIDNPHTYSENGVSYISWQRTVEEYFNWFCSPQVGDSADDNPR
jgi:hypothetical protein